MVGLPCFKLANSSSSFTIKLMENTAFILIIITLILLLIIVGLLIFIVLKILKPFSHKISPDESTNFKISSEKIHPAISDRLKGLKIVKTKRSELFCQNHNDEPGEVSCAICDTLFCKACIKPFKSLHFCKEHMPLILNKEWNEVITIKSSNHEPEQGVKLYELKKDIFLNFGIPTYVETHYKIDVDNDSIETYLVLFSTLENLGAIKKQLTSVSLL